MRITEIKKEDDIYHVTFEPYWWQKKFFGYKPKTVRYKDSGKEYAIPHVTIYIREDGKKLGPYSSISKILDEWTRAF